MRTKYEINNLFIDTFNSENYNVKPESNAVTEFKMPPALDDIGRVSRLEIGEDLDIITSPDSETVLK